MNKKFNITGNCRAAIHYMADVSKKIEETFDMVASGDYFIINRPRQYGKTTTLYTLSDLLRKTGDYVVFNTSFEGIGDAIFNDEKVFASGFVELLARYASAYAPDLQNWLLDAAPRIHDFKALSDFITQLTHKTDKKIVLLIDEVDKSSNNQLFVSFLAMLRNKYLEQEEFKTFHSVVLAGVHDVKSLKVKLRPDDERKYNSPWNIAAEFTVDMNLQPSEIQPMLEEYARDKSVEMDAGAIANRLFYYTSGYPFLVSKLCKMMDEGVLPKKLEKVWTKHDLEGAVQQLIREHNTNFDSLIKNLENYPALYDLAYKILVLGEQEDYNIYDPVVELGMTYGVFRNGQGIRIHNRIYEELIFHYMTSKTKSKLLLADYNVSPQFKTSDGRLNMEAVLLRFQAFMREQHSQHDQAFLERNGRLVFLAFLKPIINGSGYEFKEPQISEERRLDVVVTYLQYKYVVELKIWRGQAAHEAGLLQLADYLDRLALSEGFLVIFDPTKKKSWGSEWIEIRGKRAFVVWV